MMPRFEHLMRRCSNEFDGVREVIATQQNDIPEGILSEVVHLV